jgi:trk system potassium uptake protein TrkA
MMNKRRVAVLGLGQFGRALARELARCGAEVLAVDVSARRVDQVRDDVTHVAIADIRDRAALAELFPARFDVVVISIGGSLEAAIMATLYLKDMDVGEIWAEANTPEREEVLKRVGAARVISPEREVGRRVAQHLVNPNLLDFLPLTAGYGVSETEAPAWTHGKTLLELALRQEHGVAVIAARRGDSVLIAPGGRHTVEPGEKLTLVGSDRDLARFQERS